VSGEQQANELEQWFHGLPGIVQSTLHAPYRWLDDALRSVAGKPDELMAAIPKYMAIADSVAQLGQQQLADRSKLAGHWSGQAFDAFNARMQHTEEQLAKLADSVREVKGLLEAGAKAAVEGANMIVEIVKSLIMMAIQTLVINLALSAFTFGASLAAAVAEVLGEATQAIAKVAQVVEKVAQVLQKIAELFQKLEQLLQRIAQILKEIKEILADAQAVIKTTSGLENLFARGIFGLEKTVVTKGMSLATGGAVNIPGSVGGLYHGATDYHSAYQDASRAVDEVN
jgi:uncharacterized protein YukE